MRDEPQAPSIRPVPTHCEPANNDLHAPDSVLRAAADSGLAYKPFGLPAEGTAAGSSAAHKQPAAQARCRPFVRGLADRQWDRPAVHRPAPERKRIQTAAVEAPYTLAQRDWWVSFADRVPARHVAVLAAAPVGIRPAGTVLWL